jgi:cell division protein FtsB
MSVYRKHPGGLWWNSHKNTEEIWKEHGNAHVKLFIELKKLFSKNKEYQKIIDQSLYKVLGKLINTDIKIGTNLFLEVEKDYPDVIKGFIIDRQEKVDKYTKDNTVLTREVTHLRDSIGHKDHTIEKLEVQIRDMKASKFWKLRNLVARILHKEVV